MGKKRFLSLPVNLTAVLFLAVMIAGCGSDKQKGTGADFGLDSSEISEDLLDDINNAKQIFYSLPSPLETAMLIKSAGATYNEELLNPVSNTSKYTTNKMTKNRPLETAQ